MIMQALAYGKELRNAAVNGEDKLSHIIIKT